MTEFIVPDGLTPGAWKAFEPPNRLSRIADHMRQVLVELGPEAADVRAVVIVSAKDIESSAGSASVLHGYDPEDITMAIIDAISFVNAALEASGKPSRLVIQPL
jgi:hypothetical protein